MEAVIKGRTLIVGTEIFDMDDMDSKDIESYFRVHIEKYKDDIEIVNEVFIKYAHLFRAIEMLIERYQIASYKIERDADKVLVAVFKDTFAAGKKSFLSKVLGDAYFGVWSFISYVYMLVNIFIGKTNTFSGNDYEGFFVSRAKADLKMINVLQDRNILQSFDDFNNEKSFYRLFGKFVRLKLLSLAYLKSFAKKQKYYKYVLTRYGFFTAIDSVKFYAKRVVHTNLYELFVYSLSKRFEGKILFTADNLDRFAVIQEKIAKENKNKLVCIPHGIEYGFILPHCFVGDIFYTTSEKACSYLNSTYNTKKFVFNFDVAKKMFCNNVQCAGIKKIVFFSEPREPYINVKILEQLIPFLRERGLVLRLKLHPKDKIEDYKKIVSDIDIIENLDEAIANSVCVARKSTVLIEALYNGSDSVAILINNKDREIYETFPSLNDDRIKKTYSVQELKEVILKLLD